MIKKIIKLFGLVILSLVFYKVFIYLDIMAADYESIEIKIVDSFDEMYKHIDSDDYAIQIVGNGEENNYNYNQTYCVNIDRPGVLMVYTYNVGGDDIKEVVYSDYSLSKKIKSETARKKVSAYNYNWKSYSCTLVDKGTYYLNLSGSVYWFENYIAYVLLIPNDIVINTNRIVYNDDYSEATVYFSTVCKDMQKLTFVKRKIDSTDLEDIRSGYIRGCDLRYDVSNAYIYGVRSDQYYEDSIKKINNILENGLKITQNGTYTVYIKPADYIYSMFPAWVTFEVDKIGAEGPNVEVKSLKMSKTKATLKPEETLTLNATIKPKNVTEKTITWKSSNKKVATVDKNGKVTAKKKGTCTITAITSNGKKAKCKVTVKK